MVVEKFQVRVEILPWDSLAAQHYARLRSGLEEQGEPMGNLDLMIGAQALAAGAILVSSDKVFRRLKNLKVEDWTKA